MPTIVNWIQSTKEHIKVRAKHNCKDSKISHQALSKDGSLFNWLENINPPNSCPHCDEELPRTPNDVNKE